MKILFLKFLIFTNNILFFYCFLTITQWKMINNILINQNCTPLIKNKVHKIIFNKYELKTRIESIKFKKKNYKYLKNISNGEIAQYGYMGLIKSIENYNPIINQYFYKFAEKYIYYELLKSISELSVSRSILPHRILSSHKKNKNIIKQNKMYFIGENTFIIDNFRNKNDNQNNDKIKNQIIEIVNGLEPNYKRIFFLAYDDNLKKKNTIKKIAELMSLSTETIRIKLNKIKKEIQNKLKENN